MTFSATFLKVVLYGAIGGVGIGLTVLALVFVADLRGKTLW